MPADGSIGRVVDRPRAQKGFGRAEQVLDRSSRDSAAPPASGVLRALVRSTKMPSIASLLGQLAGVDLEGRLLGGASRGSGGRRSCRPAPCRRLQLLARGRRRWPGGRRRPARPRPRCGRPCSGGPDPPPWPRAGSRPAAARARPERHEGPVSASTISRTRLSVRSRAPRMYSSPRCSRAAMVAALIMPRSATTQTRPMAKRCAQRSITGSSTVTSAVLPGHISVQIGRPSPSITTPTIICIRSGRWSLEWPRSPERLPAGALEAKRRGVHEHDESSLNRSRRRANSRSSIRSLTQRGANGAASACPASGNSSPEPGHGAVEVVQRQAVDAGDRVVGQPLLAGAVGAGHHQPVQDGGEDRPLDAGTRSRAPASSSPITAAQPVSSHSRPNSSGAPMRRQARPSGLPSRSRKHEGSIGEAGHRGGETLELAAGEHGLLAAEVLDDRCLVRVLTHARDEIEVGVAVDGLLAHEHAGLAA